MIISGKCSLLPIVEVWVFLNFSAQSFSVSPQCFRCKCNASAFCLKDITVWFIPLHSYFFMLSKLDNSIFLKLNSLSLTSVYLHRPYCLVLLGSFSGLSTETGPCSHPPGKIPPSVCSALESLQVDSWDLVSEKTQLPTSIHLTMDNKPLPFLLLVRQASSWTQPLPPTMKLNLEEGLCTFYVAVDGLLFNHQYSAWIHSLVFSIISMRLALFFLSTMTSFPSSL